MKTIEELVGKHTIYRAIYTRNAHNDKKFLLTSINDLFRNGQKSHERYYINVHGFLKV